MPEENSQKEHPDRSNYKSKLWLGVVIGLVALFVAFVVGVATGRMSWRVGPNFGEVAVRKHGLVSGMWPGGGAFANQDRLAGVVTAVNGSSFTLAGNGATNTVTTNSSTQWHGGDSVKANDSVVVFGTTSNNTFTATEVVVNP